MFFRVILIFVWILSFGCTSPFNDTKTSNQDMGMSGGDSSQCLSDASVKIKRYFDGESSSAEISSFWDCMDKGLELFTEFTQGENPNEYKPSELKNFFERYFLGKQKLSYELVSQAFKIKSALFGGSPDKLTKDEVKNIRQLIQVFKSESIALLKYQPIRPENLNKLSEIQLDEVLNALLNSAKRIGTQVEKTSNSYAFYDLEKLVSSLNEFFEQSNTEVKELQVLEEILPLIRSLKYILISKDRDLIANDDWKKLLETGTKWYAWYLKLDQFKNKYSDSVSWIMGSGLIRLKSIVFEALGEIEKVILSFQDKTIPFSEFDLLIDAIGEERIRDILQNKRLKTSTLKLTLRPLIQRGFGGDIDLSLGRYAQGLTFEAYKNFTGEVDRFFEGLQFLTDLYNNATNSADWMHTPASTVVSSDVLASVAQNLKGSTNYELAKKDLMQLFLDYQNRPFYKDWNSLVVFNFPNAYGTKYSFYNLFMLHWAYSVSRILVKGYAGAYTDESLREFRRKNPQAKYPLEDLSRAKNLVGLTQDEFQKIYIDLYPLGVELYILSPKNRKAGLKRFMEANLFSFKADGGEFLSPEEMTQMFLILYSAKTLSTSIYENVSRKCELGGPDDYNKLQIEAKCFKENILEQDLLKNYVDTLPMLKAYVAKLNREDKDKLIKKLEQAVRGDRVNSAFYDTDDLDTLATLLHYVEAVYARFDMNENFVLDDEEALMALPVFDYEIRKFVNPKNPQKVKSKQVKNIFTYMLKYGKAPNPDSMGGVLHYLLWTVKRPFSDIKADRVIVYQILSELTQSSNAQIDAESKAE